MFRILVDSHTFNQMSHSDKIVTIASDWINTPYVHGARLKGVGVDCAQLIAAITEELFGERINTPVYSQEWHLHNREEMMCNLLEQFGLTRIAVEERKIGNILTFKYGRVNSHLGILVGDDEVIHARLDVGKVVKNHLSGELLQRLGRCYEFPANIINKG